MFTISKQFGFSASHQLTHLGAEHPCARLHGHNYCVDVVLRRATLEPATGFVRDYRVLDAVKVDLDAHYDHRHLNDVLGGSASTTAECLAQHFYERWKPAFPELHAVRVSETPKTWAEFA